MGRPAWHFPALKIYRQDQHLRRQGFLPGSTQAP